MKRFALLIVIAAACSAGMSLAAEGRTPIWQPTVITPPAAQGAYIVTRDVFAAGAPAVEILGVAGAFEEVEIDLNGFTLHGDPGGGPDVLVAKDLRTLTIRNGSLRALAPGGDVIRVENVERVVIEDVKTLGGGTGIFLREVASYALRRNLIVGPGASGIRVDGAGAASSFDGTIENNIVNGAGDAGIDLLFGGSSVTVRNNRVERAGSAGIRVSGADGFIIAENTIEESASFGILTENAQTCKVYNNVVTLAADAGIGLIDTHSCLVLDNVTSNNGGFGILLSGRLNHFDRNVANGNGSSGIWLQPGSIGNAYGRNLMRSNGPPAGACASTPAVCGGVDLCDDGPAGANTSFGDNFVPGAC